jgi:hypothetical protein
MQGSLASGHIVTKVRPYRLPGEIAGAPASGRCSRYERRSALPAPRTPEHELGKPGEYGFAFRPGYPGKP